MARNRPSKNASAGSGHTRRSKSDPKRGTSSVARKVRGMSGDEKGFDNQAAGYAGESDDLELSRNVLISDDEMHENHDRPAEGERY